MLLQTIIPPIYFIAIPVLAATLLAFPAIAVIRFFHKKYEPFWFHDLLFHTFGFGFLATTIMVGSFCGLIFSTFLNRKVFQFEFFQELLPNGILVFYGYGPVFTPQFFVYWKYVLLFWMIATPAAYLLSLKPFKRNIRQII